MFLDNIDYKKLNEQYLTEEYAKGKLASDYISKIRSQCSLMTFVPGFDRTKIKHLDHLIETYEDKLDIAKKELKDYRSKSKDEKDKIEKLNKIDTILSTGIKISVIVLSTFMSFYASAKTLPIMIEKLKKIIESKKIIGKLLKTPLGFLTDKEGLVKSANKIYKVAKAGVNSAGSLKDASNTMKIGGYEAEIIKCIREMEQLLVILKNKRDLFERELDKKEKGL